MFIIPAPTTQPQDVPPASWASREMGGEETQRDVVAAPRTVLRLMASISLVSKNSFICIIRGVLISVSVLVYVKA